jgi:lactaldehyde dehydrogenase/glycolaldehyde dehydrogenase
MTFEQVGGIPRYRHFIGGRWVAPADAEWIEVENPATEEVVAAVPAGGATEADEAVRAAAAAQPAWEALPPIQRARLLLRLAELVEESREKLARVVVAEQGKPLAEAYGEIEGTALYLTYAAEEARRISGDILPSDEPDEQVWIQRVAHGVVVALTAWNYPSALATRKLGPALVTGNTVVIKSHEGTPLSALHLAELSQQAGFPAGVINVVSGTGRELGEALVRHPLTALVTLTGSVRAGKEVFAAAADGLKVLRLELGGKAPLIVADDADLDQAVDAAIASRFENCGQICICNERMYQDERIADRFLERFVERAEGLKVGDPLEAVDVGPKFSAAELAKVERMVEDAKAAGAEVLTGGHRLTDGPYARGHWYAPTVLSGVDNSMDIMQREIFGPVVPAMRVASFDEALALANDSAYGLSAYVFTKDLRRLMRLVRELSFGEIYVNRPGADAVHAHHAGFRSSGLGGEDGRYGIEGYLRKKTIYVNYA